MQTRPLGRTGLTVSVLGFGCGAVGGLMVRGAPADQERAVARAVEAGITYFDTAPLYGNGASETNLGRVLRALKPDVVVGTKVRLKDTDKSDIAGAVDASLEASLRRLGRDHVDLFQLHNPISTEDEPESISARMVLDQVVPAFERLRAQGKTRFFGITAIGDTDALHQVVDAGVLHTAQVPYNLLNPSIGGDMPAGFPAQDYRDLLSAMSKAGMGAIGIRVLAGGALSGDAERHPIASPAPAPIGSAHDYDSGPRTCAASAGAGGGGACRQSGRSGRALCDCASGHEHRADRHRHDRPIGAGDCGGGEGGIAASCSATRRGLATGIRRRVALS